MKRHVAVPASAIAAAAILVACGGGGSAPGRSGSTPSATPAVSYPPPPTAMPTSAIVPATQCKVTAEPLPGTYTTIATYGNVRGTTYSQDSGPNAGTWIATAYATPLPGPTATASATPAPNPSPVTYIEYAGTYTVPGFSGLSANGPYATLTTVGCFLMVATQNGQPVAPGDPFNSYAIGFPGFSSPSGVISNSVASGNITDFTVSNLAANAGNGTFHLDSGVAGTATVTGSQVVTFAHVRHIVAPSRR